MTPASVQYDSLRRPAMARFGEIRPQLVVRCRDERDIALTLSKLGYGEPALALRSGGHCFAGRSSTNGAVIDVGLIGHVSVSPTDGVVDVGAGARLGDIYDALDEEGLTIAAGCGPTVGIAGFVLGGGLGVLGRTHGLTSDQLVGARVILADGEVVECDATRHPDLFWALRGAGGGQFGVVTQLRLRTVPAPETTCLHLTWPISRAPGVLAAWQAWAPQAPDAMAASLLLIAPDDIRRPTTVHLFGVWLGSKAEATEKLSPLLGAIAAQPDAISLTQLPYRRAKRYLAEQGPGDAATRAQDDAAASDHHSFSKSEFFARELPQHTINALLSHLSSARVNGQGRILDLTPWGGAYNRVPATATAFTHRSARYLLKQEVLVHHPLAAHDIRRARRWLEESWALVHPLGTGGVYPNFPDPELDDCHHAYHGENLHRLQRVKEMYDPGDRFRFHQSIPPAGAGTAS